MAGTLRDSSLHVLERRPGSSGVAGCRRLGEAAIRLRRRRRARRRVFWKAEAVSVYADAAHVELKDAKGAAPFVLRQRGNQAGTRVVVEAKTVDVRVGELRK